MDDEMYGLQSTGGDDDDYAYRAFMSSDPHNLQYHRYGSILPSGDRMRNFPALFESDELGFHCSASELVSVNIARNHYQHHEQSAYSVMKSQIASHPSYPKLIDAYIDCQKVGATPEMANFLDQIRREKGLCKYPMSLGVDPELDEFMETYYKILVKYKSDLSRPFDEAISFLSKIKTQLGNLCKGVLLLCVVILLSGYALRAK